MKKLTLFACLTFFCFSSIAQFKTPQYISNSRVFKLSPLVSDKDYKPATIVFKIKTAYRNSCNKNSVQISTVTAVLNSIGAVNLHKVFPNHKATDQQKNAQGLAYADLSLIYEFNYTVNLSVEAVANKLLKTGYFDFAEPHYIPVISYQPNDPMATTTGQYHLNKIKAYTAWDITKGDTNVVIGITDSGTELTHPDLTGNIKYNYNDPIDGIDNDGDSLIDNFNGWDVGMNDNNPTWQGDPHGVHVCGLAAASTDNLTGVAGVGFNCKFLPVKIANANGDLIAAYEGIVYAADHGCSIINCSWGGPGGGSFGQSVIDYATINKNALVVCAAGNDNVSTDHFPSAYNYAFSVASTTSTDNKSSFSNYGNSVDVCAPGSNVKSTYSGGTYVNNSGTSMASPVAAGGAALIKCMFPTYTGLQIGEQLKSTCDAINVAVSGFYAGKLGKGRINLFQGTTNASAKSVTMTARNITDANDEVFVGNDTLQITGDFVNFLAPLSNLTINLSSTSTFVSILNPSMPIGPMATLQQINNNFNPFLVIVSPTAPANSLVTFKLNFTDGTYTFNYYFDVVINVDYINVTVNDISTSITSKGRIGFNTDGQLDGLGFKYKNSRQLLYEAGLMIGNNSAAVSDMVRGTTAGIADEDFGSSQAVSRQIPTVLSDFDLQGNFTDNPATSPLGLNVKHKAFAWNTPGHTKYVIVEYTLTNKSAATFNSLYAGIFADWDIDDSTYGSNRAAFDAANKMGYAYYSGANGLYAGIKVLSNSAPALHYAIDNVTGGNGGVDLNNGGYSEAEKYTTLSTNRANAGVAGTGADICDVVSSGPFVLNPNDSVIVAFALLAGDSLADLQLSAMNAQVQYDSLYPLAIYESASTVNSYFSMFPNPANENIRIEFKNEQVQPLSIQFKNTVGQTVKSFDYGTQNVGVVKLTISTSDLTSGVYFCEVKIADKTSMQKIIIHK